MPLRGSDLICPWEGTDYLCPRGDNKGKLPGFPTRSFSNALTLGALRGFGSNITSFKKIVGGDVLTKGVFGDILLVLAKILVRAAKCAVYSE